LRGVGAGQTREKPLATVAHGGYQCKEFARNLTLGHFDGALGSLFAIPTI
jgi:hypothetical protein